jgi:hypothetical protein
MNQTIINLLLGTISFAFLFATLCMDFFDRKYGRSFNRLICFFGMLFDASFMLRHAQPKNDTYLWWWFAITMMFFIRKIYHMVDKAEAFEAAIRRWSTIVNEAFYPEQEEKEDREPVILER